MRGLALSMMIAAAGCLPGGLFAQEAPQSGVEMVQSPILVIDFERAFSESAFGRKLTAEVEEAGAAIAAENRRIEAQLTAEEQVLTEQRTSVPPNDFRALAEAFDQKVQRLRAEQDAKAEALGQRGEQSRREFLQAAQPVLQRLMAQAGAAVIVERRSVLVRADAVDITDRVIVQIDAAQAESSVVPDTEAPAEAEGSAAPQAVETDQP